MMKKIQTPKTKTIINRIGAYISCNAGDSTREHMSSKHRIVKDHADQMR